MSLLKINKNENPYSIIGNYIENHISLIDNIIATISIDGIIHNELFLVEITYNNNFVWLNDWWEGEENIELIDFFFVSDACKKYNNNDFISRQAVINELERAKVRVSLAIARQPSHSFERAIGRGTIGTLNDVEKNIKTLPSVQPEIIRCKNCKYWIPYDWMFSEVWQSRNIADYPEDEIGCKYCDMNMKADDYCSRAERREVTK